MSSIGSPVWGARGKPRKVEKIQGVRGNLGKTENNWVGEVLGSLRKSIESRGIIAELVQVRRRKYDTGPEQIS